MTTSAPADRRKFASDWDEIGYLYDKLLYWLYEREDRRKARIYAGRLERLLQHADPNHESIFGEECWSLVYEIKGDLPRAIKHRENEIHLIRRLHAIARSAHNEDIILKEYGHDDLSDRLDLLAVLYHDRGDLDKAIAVLKESKKFCATHAIKFDGADILREYLNQKKKPQDNSRRSSSAEDKRTAS